MSRNPCLLNNTYSDTLHDIEIAGYRYVTSTICIFGIVCNILNLCVLLQRRLKESPYTYLTGLAIADMLTLISISPFSIVRGDYIRHVNMLFTLIRLESQFYMPLANYFGQVSIMITLALTIERYLFTTYPLRTRSFCKPRYARIIIAIILFICAILSFPRFFFFTVKNVIEYQDRFNSSDCATHPFIIINNSSINSTDIVQCFCIARDISERLSPYKNIYFISMFIFNQILPVFILFFLNFKLIRRVQHSNRYTLDELVARQHFHLTLSTPSIHPIKQKRLRDEHRLTKTLVAVVVVFLICNTFTVVSYPYFIIKLTKKRYPNYFSNGFRIQTLITNIMLLLNYSINFFFYCAFNQKFLDTLKLTFRHRLCSYFYDNTYHHHHQNENLLAQQTLLTNSSFYSRSKTRSSSKRYSNSDEDCQHIKPSVQKPVCLRTFKDNDVSH